jgi:hypothetical protein
LREREQAPPTLEAEAAGKDSGGDRLALSDLKALVESLQEK